MKTKTKVLTEICSVLEYFEDRGELEEIDEIETRVRYTSKTIDEIIVTCDSQRIKIIAEEIK